MTTTSSARALCLTSSAASSACWVATRVLVRKLQVMLSAIITVLVADNDAALLPTAERDALRLSYVPVDGADALVAARTDVFARTVACLTALYERLPRELPDDTVTQTRALTCAALLLTEFGVAHDVFAPKMREAVRAFVPRLARRSAKDPFAPRWTRAALASTAVRHLVQIGRAHDGGLGRATPAVQQLLQTVATIATSSLYSDVRKQAQFDVHSAGSLRPFDARPLVEPVVATLAANRDGSGADGDKERASLARSARCRCSARCPTSCTRRRSGCAC